METALLDGPHLSLIDASADGELARIRSVLAQPVAVEGRADIEVVLGRLASHGRSPSPKTLDLIGHSTPDRSLLVIGDWVIDGTRSKVTAFFRGLADCEVFARLGITAVRLLGCETARSEGGRHTLLALSEITELDVLGTTQIVSATHYDREGFLAKNEPILASAYQLRHSSFLAPKRGGEPFRATLDIDSLPASPLGRCSWPRLVISNPAIARSVLALIRRTDGAQMPGMFEPTCELALPSAALGWYHRVQVLLDGQFVRAYPNGEDRPGVVFPVIDPAKLSALVATLNEH